MSKAGSTSIQSMFYYNKDYFRKQGIYYPFTGKVISHHDIPAHYIHLSHMEGKRTGNFIELLRKEINTVKPDKCLLSSEHFYHVLGKKEVAEVIKSIFKDYEIKIILYIRRADKRLPSLYKQQVMALRYREMNKNYGYTNHIKKLSDIKEVFGLNNSDVIIRPFEKQQFYKKNLLKDILNILGVGDPDNISEKIQPVNVRTNINLDIIEYARQMSFCVNILEPSGLTAWKEAFSGYPCPKEHEDISLFGSYKNLEDIMNHHAPIYEQIAREYLNREDGEMFYEPLPDKEHFADYPGLTIEKIARISGYLNYKLKQEYTAELNTLKEQMAEMRALNKWTLRNILSKIVKKITRIGS